MDLPVYRCVIDDELSNELQVEYVSLVDKPAIERNFLAFNQSLRFAIDNEKRIVSGPAMLADMLIYRKDDAIGEYYTTFDKATILSIVQKFFKKGYIQNFNLMHDEKTDGITVYESFITDSERGIMPMKGFEDAADGSWFITAKVDNDEVWNKIKTGEVKGFSIEGIFKQIPVKPLKMSKEQAMAQIEKIMSMVE